MNKNILILTIIALLLLMTGCGKTINEGSNVSYKITKSDAGTSNSIKSQISSLIGKRGYKILDTEASGETIYIGAGMKKSTGYQINIKDIQSESNGTLIIHISETTPKSGDFEAMAITSPYILVNIDKNPKNIEVIDDKNEQLKSL